MRVYAMYLGSNVILCILVVMVLARIGLGLAVAVVIFGPQSGISGTFCFLLCSDTDADQSHSDRIYPFRHLRLRSERQHGRLSCGCMGRPCHRHQLYPIPARRGPFRQGCPRHATDVGQLEDKCSHERAREGQHRLLRLVRFPRSGLSVDGADRVRQGTSSQRSCWSSPSGERVTYVASHGRRLRYPVRSILGFTCFNPPVELLCHCYCIHAE